MTSDLSTEDDLRLKQLSFNLTHFQRTDFDSIRFINFSRKRATLEQLHSDLRIYLRHLQNSMIELINDDYADFVNLSSGLAALRESVDKDNWYNFESTISDMEKCAQLVNNYLTQLDKSRKEQIIAKNKLSLLQSIQRLYKFLENKPKDINKIWFSKLFILISSTEYWLGCFQSSESFTLQLEIAKEKCYKKATDLVIDQLCEEFKLITNSIENKFSIKTNLATLLSSIKLLHEKEKAELHIVSYIMHNLRIVCQKKLKTNDLLEEVLDKVIYLRQCWVTHACNYDYFSEELAIFFDSCLLNSMFSTVLVPTDAHLFHSCFKLITEKFIRCWPTKNETFQLGLLRSIRDKFNLVIYFKLASQPLIISIKEHLKPEEFKYKIPVDGDFNPCFYSYSNSILSSLSTLYSTDYFLPSFANKFWEFTLQRMQDYLEWTKSSLDYFNSSISVKQHQISQPDLSKPSDLISPCRTTTSSFKESSNLISSNNFSSTATIPPTWLCMAALFRDIQLFDATLFQFCLSTIWDCLRQLKIDPTPFGQCLSLFSGQLTEKRKEIEQKLFENIGGELAKNLSAVSDIPRQYRWTKRPHPVGFSSYLSSCFEAFEQFGHESKKVFGLNEDEINYIQSQAMLIALDDFCERAGKVLDGVEQTGSSLLRFKQRKAATSGQQSTPELSSDSDETKMRTQLCFDVNFVKQKAEEWLSPEYLEKLIKLEQRASNFESSAKINDLPIDCEYSS